MEKCDTSAGMLSHKENKANKEKRHILLFQVGKVSNRVKGLTSHQSASGKFPQHLLDIPSAWPAGLSWALPTCKVLTERASSHTRQKRAWFRESSQVTW